VELERGGDCLRVGGILTKRPKTFKKTSSQRLSFMSKAKKHSDEAAEEIPESLPEEEGPKPVDIPIVNSEESTVEGDSEKKKKKKVVPAVLGGERVLTEVSDEAREFYNQSRFGNLLESGKVELSLLEALYLMEKGRLDVQTESGKLVTFEQYLKKARKIEPNFWIRYCVFKDMRNRGYIIKTALKFGADFRVYDRGVKPGEDHARWIVYPVHEGETLTWYEFAAKNRVAHSTKKRLLMGIVDDEGDVTYYEIKWMRP